MMMCPNTLTTDTDGGYRDMLVLPDAVFEQLRHLLDMEAKNQWAVGDFIVDVWTEIEKYTPEDERKQAHAKMITEMATKTGADKSTLRSREKVAGFFDERTRNRWVPPYTYHHMRALAAVGEGWEEVALWGLSGGHNGHLATVDEMRQHIKGSVTPEQWRFEQFDKLDLHILRVASKMDGRTQLALYLIRRLLYELDW